MRLISICKTPSFVGMHNAPPEHAGPLEATTQVLRPMRKFLERVPIYKGTLPSPPGSRTSDPLYQDYMNAAHEWTQKHQGIIFEQFGALHPYTSLSAPRFTMDDAYQRHALTALAQLQPALRWEEGHLLLDLKESRHALMDALERCEIHHRTSRTQTSGFWPCFEKTALGTLAVAFLGDYPSPRGAMNSQARTQSS